MCSGSRHLGLQATTTPGRAPARDRDGRPRILNRPELHRPPRSSKEAYFRFPTGPRGTYRHPEGAILRIAVWRSPWNSVQDALHGYSQPYFVPDGGW